MKDCGAPAMRERWTLIQSVPVVLSTTDQPWRVAGGCCGGLGTFGVGEEDAVGGLPDGDFGDVRELEFAGAGAVVVDGEVAEALVAVGVDELEVAGDVGVEGGVEEADGGGGGELEGADFACVGDDGDEGALVGGFGVGVRSGGGGGADFHGEEAACDGEGAGVHLDAGAADGAVEVRCGRVFAQRERQVLELLIERRCRVVAGTRNAAAIEVDGSERLEDIVELAAGEGERYGGIAGNGSGVLEEAYAVFVERDAGHGKARRVPGGCLGVGFLRAEYNGQEK